MIKAGNIFRLRNEDWDTGKVELCEIIHTYNKPDIDPECPESVAIIGMVKAVWLSGPHIGQTFRASRRNFNFSWQILTETANDTTQGAK